MGLVNGSGDAEIAGDAESAGEGLALGEVDGSGDDDGLTEASARVIRTAAAIQTGALAIADGTGNGDARHPIVIALLHGTAAAGGHDGGTHGFKIIAGLGTIVGTAGGGVFTMLMVVDVGGNEGKAGIVLAPLHAASAKRGKQNITPVKRLVRMGMAPREEWGYPRGFARSILSPLLTRTGAEAGVRRPGS